MLGMGEPRVSVVVPVFNRQCELRRALDSLLQQTMDDFECIVVDDASTLPIRPIVDEYDDRFVYVRNDQNAGCTGARFLGLERTQGHVYLGLDSDNELFPWTLERTLTALREHPEVDGVAGLFVFPDGFRIRVRDGTRVVTPVQYAHEK